MREIEHLSRLYIAYQFLLAEDTKERSAEELKEMQDKIVKLQEELSENDKKIKALSHEIEELEKRKDKVRHICKNRIYTLKKILNYILYNNYLRFTGHCLLYRFLNLKV